MFLGIHLSPPPIHTPTHLPLYHLYTHYVNIPPPTLIHLYSLSPINMNEDYRVVRMATACFTLSGDAICSLTLCACLRLILKLYDSEVFKGKGEQAFSRYTKLIFITSATCGGSCLVFPGLENVNSRYDHSPIRSMKQKLLEAELYGYKTHL